MNVGIVYLIRHRQSGLYKIGVTRNWARRSKELGIGESTAQVTVGRVLNHLKLEKALHRQFDEQRLPQSEWFNLSAEQAQQVRSTITQHEEHFKTWRSELQQRKPSIRPPAKQRPQWSRTLDRLAWVSAGLALIGLLAGASGAGPVAAVFAAACLLVIARFW